MIWVKFVASIGSHVICGDVPRGTQDTAEEYGWNDRNPIKVGCKSVDFECLLKKKNDLRPLKATWLDQYHWLQFYF